MNQCDLYCGNCLELMQLLPDKSVDMVICDPPYGVTHNKWDKELDLGALWSEYNRITKDNAAILMFGSGKFLIKLAYSNLKYYRHKIVWKKTAPTGFLNAGRTPLRAHEDILVFYRKPPNFNRVYIENMGVPYIRIRKRDRSGKCYGAMSEAETCSQAGTERLATDVLTFSKDNNRKSANSTSKPVKLLELLIKMYSNEGQTVLDNCMGYGSTAIACANTNRNFIGMELNRKMYDSTKLRLQSHGIIYTE